MLWWKNFEQRDWPWWGYEDFDEILVLANDPRKVPTQNEYRYTYPSHKRNSTWHKVRRNWILTISSSYPPFTRIGWYLGDVRYQPGHA
jgi:hypothetical protein